MFLYFFFFKVMVLLRGTVSFKRKCFGVLFQQFLFFPFFSS